MILPTTAQIIRAAVSNPKHGDFLLKNDDVSTEICGLCNKTDGHGSGIFLHEVDVDWCIFHVFALFSEVKLEI